MTMEITQLEQKHRSFYAPTFRVKVNGQDLLSDLFLQVPTVQVDSTLEGADRFSFTVNSTFDTQKREFEQGSVKILDDLFTFGNPVEVYCGYLDASSLTLMHRGIITAVQTSFPSSGLPQINVSGYDLSYPMTKGKKSRNWDNKKDSEIVALIAADYGLNPQLTDTQVVQPKIEQSQESDYELLRKLAQRNGYEFYTFDRTLYFNPPRNDQSPVVSLEWSKGLVSFSPEINISEQISKVEVRGWNVNTKKELIGIAQAGDEPGRDPGRRSGAEFIKKICKDSGELKVRIPAYTQQEVDRKAKALLTRRSEMFVKGKGEAIGLPEIFPDRNVELKGLGKLFSKIYYVEQATHTVSSSGYRTTFGVKDTTI
jgi:phage protein D